MSRPQKKNRSPRRGATLNPGEIVIIRQNPHHLAAADIVGTIVALRPGEGVGGCDLVDVNYKHPETGRKHTLPFCSRCLEKADVSKLIALAEHHETIAEQIRALADKVRRVNET